MKFQLFILLFVALLVAGCSSSDGPARIVNPPPPPPTGGTPPPTGPVLPGIGDTGKIRVQVEEGGTVTSSPNIGSCAGQVGSANCEFTAQRGTVVTLNAQPWAGWAFEEWDNCSAGSSGTQCVVTMDALSHVKAEFDRN